MTPLLILNIFSAKTQSRENYLNAPPDYCYEVVVVRENLGLCETFMIESFCKNE